MLNIHEPVIVHCDKCGSDDVVRRLQSIPKPHISMVEYHELYKKSGGTVTLALPRTNFVAREVLRCLSCKYEHPLSLNGEGDG